MKFLVVILGLCLGGCCCLPKTKPKPAMRWRNITNELTSTNHPSLTDEEAKFFENRRNQFLKTGELPEDKESHAPHP